jgi:hypothetical protein
MTWRKSSKSADAGQCVEVRNDLAAIRDSMSPGVAMIASRAALTRLTMFAQARR